jgi:hypothetical protein
MGYQDRGYYADRRQPFAAEWSGVNAIIALNVAVWLANFIFAGNLFEGLLPPFSLNEAFCLPEDLPRQPQYFYTLLTYGFLHDSSSPWHLIFNMVTLWFFGREIEAVLGRAEFIRFYCASIIFAGLGWVVVERFSHPTMAADRRQRRRDGRACRVHLVLPATDAPRLRRVARTSLGAGPALPRLRHRGPGRQHEQGGPRRAPRGRPVRHPLRLAGLEPGRPWEWTDRRDLAVVLPPAPHASRAAR